MAKKIAKGLWISATLAEEFDREVERLAGLMPEKLEAGAVGAAALLSFIHLPDDKQKLEAIKVARNYALDKAIESLPPGELGTAEDAGRVVDAASGRQAERLTRQETRQKRKAGA